MKHTISYCQTNNGKLEIIYRELLKIERFGYKKIVINILTTDQVEEMVKKPFEEIEKIIADVLGIVDMQGIA